MHQLLWLAIVAGVMAALNLVLPWFANPYVGRVIMLCGINIVLAVSLNLINGFTGQFSIGHAGFMAIGGYASAMFSLHVGRHWVTSLVAAGVPQVAEQGAALIVAVAIGGLLDEIGGFRVGRPYTRL